MQESVNDQIPSLELLFITDTTFRCTFVLAMDDKKHIFVLYIFSAECQRIILYSFKIVHYVLKGQLILSRSLYPRYMPDQHAGAIRLHFPSVRRPRNAP